MHEALGEEQIVEAASVDMGHPPRVADDLHLGREARYGDRASDLRKTVLGEFGEGRGGRVTRREHDERQGCARLQRETIERVGMPVRAHTILLKRRAAEDGEVAARGEGDVEIAPVRARCA